MRLRVLGAAREVTGSSYLLEVGGKRLLIDCGLHQGENEELNYENFDFDPTSVDVCLLTHAHVDHSGRIPQLVSLGFKGPVITTLPTAELVELLWRDSAKLMAEDARTRSRKNARRGLPTVEPLYGDDEVNAAVKRLKAVSFDDMIDVTDGVKARFRDAGHIMGSAIVELFLTEGDEHLKIVFSGDLGPQEAVMEREPAVISDADLVLIESTYGDREHRGAQETRAEFKELMGKITAEGGKIFVPSFVVDRAQRVLYELSLLRDQGLAQVPVYFDSPMGAKVTEIYNRHLDLLSAEVQEYRRQGHNPFEEGVTYVSEAEESRKLNDLKSGIFVAGSGMATGGRIVHHLKNNLFDPKCHVVFVGYQAKGTLGRALVDGAKVVRVNGEEVAVKASIHTLGGFSAHADRTDLLTWAENFRPTAPLFLVVHGEEKSSEALQQALKSRGFEALVPHKGDEFTLRPRALGAAMAQAAGERQKAGDLVREGALSEVVEPAQLNENRKSKQAVHKTQKVSTLASEVSNLAFTLGEGPVTQQIITALEAAKMLLAAAKKEQQR